jgi:hypothetical protein
MEDQKPPYNGPLPISIDFNILNGYDDKNICEYLNGAKKATIYYED